MHVHPTLGNVLRLTEKRNSPALVRREHWLELLHVLGLLRNLGMRLVVFVLPMGPPRLRNGQMLGAAERSCFGFAHASYLEDSNSVRR